MSDISDKIINFILRPRSIERHANGEGSVIALDMFGQKTNLLVADAKYRVAGIFDGVPENYPLIGNGIKVRGYRALRDSEYFRIPDWLLQLRLSSLKNDGSAKENTDFFANVRDYATNSMRAIAWCRSRDFDLPNLYELMVIYLEADRLDALDPTVKDNPEFALGYRNPHGYFRIGGSYLAWSSTAEISLFESCAIEPCSLTHWGEHRQPGRLTIGGVIPVREC